jgi:hypothetical protein
MTPWRIEPVTFQLVARCVNQLCYGAWKRILSLKLNPLNAKLNPIFHLLALLAAHHILHISKIMVNTLNSKLIPICHLLALLAAHHILHVSRIRVNPLKAKLNPICHLLALLAAHHILHVSRIGVNNSSATQNFTDTEGSSPHPQ